MNHSVLRALAAGVALSASLATGALGAAPPSQPKSGPGSFVDSTGEVVRRAVGRASNTTYVFHMASAPAEPRSVVVLLHAWGAVNPAIYGAWIEQLARGGHLVLFPAFQQLGKTRPMEATETTAVLIKAALAELATDPQAKPDPGKLLYVGHSAGSAIAMNLAASARDLGLPVPKLVYAIMPGGIASDERARGIMLADLSKVDADTTIATIVGDREFQAADRASRRILRETSAVPISRKLFMRAASDDHGFPALSATLASPASPNEGYDSSAIKVQPDPPVDPKLARQNRPRWAPDMVLTGEQTVLVGQLQRGTTDTLDYLAYWKTFDMLAAATLSGGDMAGLRADPAFLDMGRWTDGWPVRRLTAEIPKAPAEASTATVNHSASRADQVVIQSKQPVIRKRR